MPLPLLMIVSVGLLKIEALTSVEEYFGDICG